MAEIKYDKNKFRERYKDDYGEVRIVKPGEKIDTRYGMENVVLTDKHLKALEEGSALEVDIMCGEYTCVIEKE